jgi:hypothetical protein
MDLVTVAIVFVAGLLLFGVIVFMLNRAWGDFPTRLTPPYQDAPAPRRSGAEALLSTWDSVPAEDGEDEGDDEGEAGLPAGASAENLIPVTHPQVKLAVLQALERGGTPYATYFIRDGERVYLVASRIADPAQRERIVRAFQALNGGDLTGVSLIDMVRTMQQLGK